MSGETRRNLIDTGICLAGLLPAGIAVRYDYPNAAVFWAFCVGALGYGLHGYWKGWCRGLDEGVDVAIKGFYRDAKARGEARARARFLAALPPADEKGETR